VAITICHNPACGTSRNVLAMIRNSSEEPRVIEYLKTSPTRAELVDLIARMGISARDLLRQKGRHYAEMGLHNPGAEPRRTDRRNDGSPHLSRCRVARSGARHLCFLIRASSRRKAMVCWIGKP
jgi:hypothetical protein